MVHERAPPTAYVARPLAPGLGKEVVGRFNGIEAIGPVQLVPLNLGGTRQEA